MTRYVVLRIDTFKPIGTVSTAGDWLTAQRMAEMMYGYGKLALKPTECSTLERWAAALKDRQADREEADTMQAMRKG